MSAGDVHSILYRGKDPMKMQIEASNKTGIEKKKENRPQRLWPGKAPDYAGEAEDDSISSVFLDAITPHILKQYSESNTEMQDRRLKRIKELEEGRVDSESSKSMSPSSSESIPSPQKKIIEHLKSRQIIAHDPDPLPSAVTTVVLPPESAFNVEAESEPSPQSTGYVGREMNENENDSELVASRRAIIREIAAQKRREEEQRKAALPDDNGLDMSESSEEESDIDDGDVNNVHILKKPTFVRADGRDAKGLLKTQIEERQRLLEEEQAKQVAKKKETRNLVVEILKAEDDIDVKTVLAPSANVDLPGVVYSGYDSELQLPDDTDQGNESDEYEEWKLRELNRIKRDKEEVEARMIFNAEIEKRRGMTDNERKEDDKRIDLLHPRAPKGSKYQFLQKYYHSGSFFQNEKQDDMESIYRRDFNQPIMDDLRDRKTLPKVMQLRRGDFGRAGRSKHTHLADVDTTDFTSPWTQSELNLVKRPKLNDMHGR